MRAKISRTLTNGVSLISPLWYLICIGLPRGGAIVPTNVEGWKKVKWGEASGSTYDWRITKTRSSASTRSAQLRTRDFAEIELLANPSVPYYYVEQTWAIADGDLELNKNDDTKISSIRQDRMTDAQDAVWAELANWPWYGTETGHNAGLTRFSPTNVAGSATYAGISMAAANAYFSPTGTDYGTITLAANLLQIIETLKVQLTVSKNAGGGGGRASPDLGVMDPLAWAQVLQYFSTKVVISVTGGNMPANANLYENGFDNSVVDGVCLFWDENFGGATGYVDGAAVEEIMMGHSDKMHVVTTNTRDQGFIRALDWSDNPVITGEVGVFKTGMSALVFESPKFFQVAYT
jgi:hypothetical protein